MAPHALGGKPRSLDVVEEMDFEGDEQKLPRDAKSAIKDTNMVDSSTVSLYSVLSLNFDWVFIWILNYSKEKHEILVNNLYFRMLQGDDFDVNKSRKRRHATDSNGNRILRVVKRDATEMAEVETTEKIIQVIITKLLIRRKELLEVCFSNNFLH